MLKQLIVWFRRTVDVKLDERGFSFKAFGEWRGIEIYLDKPTREINIRCLYGDPFKR